MVATEKQLTSYIIKIRYLILKVIRIIKGLLVIECERALPVKNRMAASKSKERQGSETQIQMSVIAA